MLCTKTEAAGAVMESYLLAKGNLANAAPMQDLTELKPVGQSVTVYVGEECVPFASKDLMLGAAI